MGWIDSLKSRWKLDTGRQALVVLLVFACTGLTVVAIKRPILSYLFDGGPMSSWASVVYYILILPIYNVFLLVYGFIFGHFSFFWNFEKKLFARMFGSKKNPVHHEK